MGGRHGGGVVITRFYDVKRYKYRDVQNQQWLLSGCETGDK